MKWNVTNALNRDVERQHLNKILAEIQAAINTIESNFQEPNEDVRAIVGGMVEGNSEQGISVTYNSPTAKLDFAVNDFIISLTGDVTGRGTVSSLRDVAISVTIDPSKIGIPEAPIDSNAYWRLGGHWEPVPWAVMKLDTVEGDGVIVHYSDEEDRAAYVTRIFEAAAGELTITNPSGVDGNPLYGLADLVDTGVGTSPVQLFTRDAKGRVEGTEDADTDDLPEGLANLYFTNDRADARIELQKGQPLGLATLDINSKLDAGQLPALAITDTFVVNTEAAMLALDAQQGDVAVRTDLSQSFILTADPASTLTNWQELLVPTGGVASFNGRTGSVVPATGDYTAAQVGADPVGSAAAAQAAAQTYADGKIAQTIVDGDTTHSPSGDAVFDALSGKFDKAGGTITGSTTIGTLLYADAINSRLGVGGVATAFQFEIMGSSAGVAVTRTGGGESFIQLTDSLTSANGGQVRGLVGSPGLRFTDRSSGVEWGRWDGPDFKINGGRLFGTALHNNPASMTGAINQFVGSGTYSPTLTNVTNIASSSAVQAQWLRVGNVVTVSGRIDLTPSAIGVASQVDINLPIASNLVGGGSASGAAGLISGSSVVAVSILADTTNDRVRCFFTPTTTAAHSGGYTFTYVIV